MLTTAQKQKLKALAHNRKPVVIIGGNGLTESVSEEIGRALNDHELIKVRVNAADRTQRDGMIGRICEGTGAELVQRIGHVAVLYRRNADGPKVTL